MVWIFLLYDGLNQICTGVYLFFVLIYLIFVLHYDFMCSSVSRFKQMQMETLLMYMMQPSRFNPMVQTPWSHHADFPDMENIGSFALYKNFTLFEIVAE
jgi:hypothetical protein